MTSIGHLHFDQRPKTGDLSTPYYLLFGSLGGGFGFQPNPLPNQRAEHKGVERAFDSEYQWPNAKAKIKSNMTDRSIIGNV